ncbi:MAG: hypothetical protein GXY33_19610 [Phycisphaerae bacterium]|nr:hypothetical protein [Phycisphaerae bacterium]
MPKLTLSMDNETIALARELAAASGVSVSNMVARMIHAMKRPPLGKIRIGPIARRASGLIRMAPDEDERETLADALIDKYESSK